jgi:solute:Na+ symporter, SSS family
MHWIDWTIIGGYVVLITCIGLAFVKRASGSVAQYFVAGRNLPWWIAGTSLVATSFAADTPLFVTGVVAEKGIAGNWLWWNQVVAWALAMVFFAQLWRRAGIMTDAEFIELRYGGRPGAFLRGFKAVYTPVIFSTWTIAWVMLGMHKIVSATLGRPAWAADLQTAVEGAFGLAPGSVDLWKWIVLISLFLVTTFYTALSGLWGIVITDLVQFTVKMTAAVLFAIWAVKAVGGMDMLRERLTTEFGAERASNLFAFFPERESPWMPISTFAIYLGVLWWGDCGGFAAQRFFSTRSERDSVLTAVWYSIAHFALRPWAWIVVALVSLVYYPHLPDPEMGYPRLMMEVLPVGLRGMMIASLLAAFMSTVNTHLNWNASYFVGDVYIRFIAPAASERQRVRVSRLAVLGFAALAIVIAYFMTSIGGAVVILLNLQAGIGLVIMLRWFWWRINAWSEISAMIASLVTTTLLHYLAEWHVIDWSAAVRIVATAGICAAVWIPVTLLTPPSGEGTLDAFYRRIRPQAALWRPVARRCPEVTGSDNLGAALINWVLCAVAFYAAMIGIGKLVFGEYTRSLLGGGVCAAAALLLLHRCRRPRNASPV